MTEIEYTNKISDILKDEGSFKHIYDDDKYVILVNQKRVVLKSGKSIWNSKGSAKCALKYHLNRLIDDKVRLKWADVKSSTWPIRQVREKLLDDWVKKNVEIIKYKDYIKILLVIGEI